MVINIDEPAMEGVTFIFRHTLIWGVNADLSEINMRYWDIMGISLGFRYHTMLENCHDRFNRV